MAAKKKRRTAGRRKSDKVAGWVYMSMGLSIGLAVAMGIYVSDRQTPDPVVGSAPVPADLPEPPSTVASEPEDEPEEVGITYDFYEMLPNLDVEVYEDERVVPKPVPAAPVVQAPVKAAPVQAPGIYILQAGSFSKLEDASRRKAQVALLGVRTEIKQGDANGRNVYRVYTDPMDNPTEVNRVSNLLTSSSIEVLMKRVK
jgi:cell division protein FtsN